jgi:hypothetical protein
LIDRAGNDRYLGETTAQGSAINNSVALLFDHAGDDFYAGADPKQSQAAGHDGGRREFGSIALQLDLGGTDAYSQGQTNNAVWTKPWHGAGLDCEATNLPAVVGATFLSRPEPESRLERRSYEKMDPHHAVERLLRRTLRDTDTEEHRKDAETAWAELKQQGTNALPYLLRRLDSPSVMVRAKIEELIDHLNTNAVPSLIAGIDSAKNEEVARLCCYFLARFESATNAIPHLLPLLNREKTQAVALYTLGHLHARAAFEPALTGLKSDRESVRLRAAQALGRIGDKRAIPALINALDDDVFDVRYAAADALVALGKPGIGPLRAVLNKISDRTRPHIIEVLSKLGDRRGEMLEKLWRANVTILPQPRTP